jgi:hypothetical protein
MMAIALTCDTTTKSPVRSTKRLRRLRDAKGTAFDISAEGCLVKVKARQNAPAGGGKRGEVENYSSASRRRFMELFASLDKDVLLSALAGRLSWSDDNLPDGKEASRVKAETK